MAASQLTGGPKSPKSEGGEMTRGEEAGGEQRRGGTEGVAHSPG